MNKQRSIMCCFGKNSTPPITASTNTIETDDQNISKNWRNLSGQNNWDGLLNPLSIDLRQYIIRYGEMAQATYDTFNSQKKSKYAGTSIYSKDNFFSKLGLAKGHSYKYSVTKFLYAVSSVDLPQAFMFRSASREAWCKESNWIGYVAVASDEAKLVLGRRDIVIAWRGTIQSLEWVNDFQFLPVSAKKIVGDLDGGDDPKVHRGWLSIYTSDDERSRFNKTSARDQVIEEVKRLVELYKNEELSITITGHSLGAAIATLNAIDIIANGYNKVSISTSSDNGISCPVTAFLFACPRVGDSALRKLFTNYKDLKVLRVRNALDLVPNYPLIGYVDIGQELGIDSMKSNYLKNPGSISMLHNLEVYMHTVAGTQGVNEGFKLEVNRDVALVNKSLDGLKDDYCIPGSWRVLENNGMVQQDDGSWKLMDHEVDHDA